MSTVFQGSLCQTINFGQILEIGAKAKEKATRFYIFLSNGPLNKDSDNDIGLLLMADMVKCEIKLKQRINNEWNKEISREFTTATFKTEFKIYIVVAESKFHIAINGKPFGTYKCEHPLPQLDTLAMEGGLEYVKQLDHRLYFPYAWPLIQIKDDYLDFSNDQPMAFKPGHLMLISMRLFGNANGRFMIHLRNARDHTRQEFHASFRFHTKEFFNKTNIIQQGDILAFNDDDAEIECYLPFDDFFKPFKLVIALTENEMKIAKDGQFICDYVYRTPNVLHDIAGVKIFGINGVNVRVSAIDHVQLNNSQCLGFESYSKK